MQGLATFFQMGGFGFFSLIKEKWANHYIFLTPKPIKLKINGNLKLLYVDLLCLRLSAGLLKIVLGKCGCEDAA